MAGYMLWIYTGSGSKYMLICVYVQTLLKLP